MDYYLSIDIAKKLEDAADLPELEEELRVCLRLASHFLRIYSALESVYREKLGGEFCEIGDQVNRLFSQESILHWGYHQISLKP